MNPINEFLRLFFSYILFIVIIIIACLRIERDMKRVFQSFYLFNGKIYIKLLNMKKKK